MKRGADADTIAAIATGAGDAGVGIVRVSGPRAGEILTRVFDARGEATKRPPTHLMRYGAFVDPDGGEGIDEGLAVAMWAPRSYTGEDVVELHCHGGRVVLSHLLRACVACGARAAEAGEFTRRAFMNGRLDLAQAEAVADLISARSAAAAKLAQEQLGGRLSQHLAALRDELLSARAVLEAAVDFAEEDEGATERSSQEARGHAGAAVGTLETLLAGFETGRRFREGLRVVVAGRPNVGKSSLFNALLGSERSIVTHEAGTTRDVIQEELIIDGIALRLTDVAGLRDTPGLAEAAGVERARQQARDADLVVWLFDRSVAPTQDELEEHQALTEAASMITVLNKCDLPADAAWRESDAIEISALVGAGVEDLREALRHRVASMASDDPVVSNARHASALRAAQEALSRTVAALEQGLSPEFAASDLQEAQRLLGEVTGETVTEDVLARIFSRFCIGK